MSEVAKPRPEYRNINALGDLPSYRWPLAALVSGAHRLSGVLMFLLGYAACYVLALAWRSHRGTTRAPRRGCLACTRRWAGSASTGPHRR